MASGRNIFWVLAALVTIALALLAPSASAKKTHLFLETFGSVAKPSFENANGLAVDRSNGDLLVIDTTAKTISRYHADGTPHDFAVLGTNVIDAKGTGNCPSVPSDCDQTPQNGFFFTGFAGEQQVAVDNSGPGSETDGNIYVTQGHPDAGNLVDIFASNGEYLGQLTAAGATPFGTTGSFPFSPCGVAVGESGNLFLAGGYDNKIYKFDPTANPPLNGDHVASFPTGVRVCSLAAGTGPSSGSLFVNTFFTMFEDHSVLKLDSSTGELECLIEPGESRVVTVDHFSGRLFVLDSGGGLSEYNVSGCSADLVSSSTTGGTGIAVDGASDRVYVAGEGVRVFGPLVTVPDVLTGNVTITGDTSVTLHGTVNPDGVAIEECFFEYGTTIAYDQTAPCEEPDAAEVGAGAGPVAVHADISGLGSETFYHYRLVAKNSNATVKGEDQSFKTPSKPAIGGIWAEDVTTTEATLRARINPENSPTTYRFEWGPDENYGNSTPNIPIGSDNTDRTVSLTLSDLQPESTYHWRVVAGNGIGTTEAPDHIFTTFAVPPPLPEPDPCPNGGFRTGPGAHLPDCRAYEMVSPLDKGGADIVVRGTLAGVLAGIHQSTPAGGKLTYSSYRAFGDAQSSAWTSQYIASRDAERQEWTSHGISPSRGPLVISPSASQETEFRAFSEDLCLAWLRHDTDPPLVAGALEGFVNLYRRENCGVESYEAITTVPPQNLPLHLFLPNLQGHSADGKGAVFRINDELTDDANSGTNYQCYGKLAGNPSTFLISVLPLPNGKASKQNCSVGTANSSLSSFRNESVDNAVSEDASRIFWTASTGDRGPGQIYVRMNGFAPGAECAKGSSPCTVAVGPELAQGQFWTATPDGSLAIFTNGDLNGGAADLYEFEVEKKETRKIAGKVRGLLGTSEDVSRIYLVSEEDRDEGGSAAAGAPNLYLYEAGEGGDTGTFRFIATLSAEDATAVTIDLTLAEKTDRRLRGVPSPVNVNPLKHSAQVTPDGDAAAFMSTASLTGYDNLDAASGEADAEVFHYDASANGGTGQLRCVSCNPTEARPAGRNIGHQPVVIKRVWVAAQLPFAETQFHFPRLLSEDGQRLFFESYEGLVLRDNNNMRDVYQWEAMGKGGCSEDHSDFSPKAGGCVSLISSGRSPADSDFVDASADGSDVFFKSGASLLPHDPGLIDIYDARVEGGLPIPRKADPPCEGEACQSPPAPPQAPTPASSVFRGPGDLKGGTKPKPCGKGKRRVRRAGKARCVRHERNKGKKHKRHARKQQRKGTVRP